MHRLPYFFLVFLLLCTSCSLSQQISPESSSTPTIEVKPLVDSFFYGYAYIDTNGDQKLGEEDLPLEGALFTATDARGFSAGGKTDAEGRGMAWWPAESEYPITLRMQPPDPSTAGDPFVYTLISPQEVVLAAGTFSAEFLFAPPPMPSSSPTSSPSNSTKPRIILDALLDYQSHTLAVTEKIFYSNQSSEELKELVLIVEPNRYDGVFQMESLSISGSVLNNYSLEANRLTLPLSKPLPPGNETTLEITYQLNLPSPVPNPYSRPVPFGYTSRQTNLVDWYPFIAPFIPGKGWIAHDPGYFGEHLAYDVSDFLVNIRLAGYLPDSESALPPTFLNQTGQKLIIAASSAGVLQGEGYQFDFPNARNFVWSISHDYVVKIKDVGGVKIVGYTFAMHESAGDGALESTALSFELYNRLFSPYSHQTLSVVEADFLDGMEYDGLYFLSNGFYNLYTGTPSEYLVAIAAHETAHQWWYGLVGNDQAQEPWLDEALCTYSEKIFYENIFPEALDWWWTYRINYYQPKGKIDGSIYSFSSSSDAYRSYRDAVYLNGALFFNDLREEMGDQAFFDFLRAYATQNSYKITSTEKFIKLLQKNSQVDISSVIQYYFSNH